MTKYKTFVTLTEVHKADTLRYAIENWRPKTLLNINYKIATRILAKRVQNILQKIINMDQQGYSKVTLKLGLLVITSGKYRFYLIILNNLILMVLYYLHLIQLRCLFYFNA